MAIVDFIEGIDDIIDLTSDEENVQEDHTATQHWEAVHDGQTMFVVAAEGRQHVQAMFALAAAGEERQETTKSRNAAEATASSSVTGKAPLDTASSQSRPHSQTAVPYLSLTSTTPKATSEGCDAKLLRAKVKRPRKNYHTDTPKRCPRLEEKRKGHNKSVEELAVDRKRPYMLDAA